MRPRSVSKLDYALQLSEEVDDLYERRGGLTRAFHDILRAADAAGVRLVLCGALARNVYLRPRSTDDADFLVRSMEDVRKVVAAAAARFDAQGEPDPITRLTHRASGKKVDLIVAEYPFELEAFELAKPCRVRRREVAVMPPDHLAAMKVDAASDPGREYDFADVVRMIRVHVADAERVAGFVRRDLPAIGPTLEAILRVAAESRTKPARTRRGTSRNRS